MDNEPEADAQAAAEDAWVYIVQCADNTLYTGYTVDLAHRLKAHNEGRGAKYTRTRRPVSYVYTEKCPNRHCALRREYEIKSMTRTQKLELIAHQRNQ